MNWTNMGDGLHDELSFLDQRVAQSRSLLECSFALRLSALLALTIGTPSVIQSDDQSNTRSSDV
jgi:hypothetical protein